MDDTPTLFELPSPEEQPERPEPEAEPRVERPNRKQLELRAVDLESTLPANHRARVVWEFVAGLDLGPLYREIKAVEGHAGRPAIDPAILMALWLYATVDGVGSARAVARLCEEHDAYRWVCGGVSVNYHTLADFRVQHAEYLDELLTTSVAALMAEGLVELTRVAQDGVRVRASAGAASFRREPRLQAYWAEAAAQVAAVRQELEDDPAATTRRQAAARQRAATERQQRVAKALEQVAELQAQKKAAAEREKARASTTDPEARVMKMADGGFRPAFNGQFATDTATQIIVGVDASNVGSDQGQLAPMTEQLQERFGTAPREMLVDGGFVTLDDITAVAQPEVGCTVYAPVPTPRAPGRDPYQRRPADSEAVAQWRERMGTDAAKAIYKERAATSECVNAIARNRGLQRFLVRGLRKIKAVLVWFALAHNLMRAVALRQATACTPL
jgi:transposase